MKDNFPEALKAVLVHEGGYVDHPRDPGGATNRGITRRTLAAWRGIHPYTKLPKTAVKTLTMKETSAIYKARYWDRLRGDDLPSGVDFAVFDFGVSSGVSRSAIYLQNILDVAPDGKIGPITLAAADLMTPAVVIDKLCDNRLAFLKRLSIWPTFKNGWTRRVKETRALAHTMDALQRQPDDPGVVEPTVPHWTKLVINFIVNLLKGLRK